MGKSELDAEVRVLKAMKDNLGWSNKKLAGISGVTPSMVSQMFRHGKLPSSETRELMRGELEKAVEKKEGDTVGRILVNKRMEYQEIISVYRDGTLAKAAELMWEKDIDQMPVRNSHGDYVGSITSKRLRKEMEKGNRHRIVGSIMEAPFPIVGEKESRKVVARILDLRRAVLVQDDHGKITGFLTDHDFLNRAEGRPGMRQMTFSMIMEEERKK